MQPLAPSTHACRTRRNVAKTRAQTHTRSSTSRALALCATLLAAGSVWAATPQPVNSAQTSAAQARYQQERAACLNGQSNQERATCLREANAALVEARHGGMDSSAVNLPDNQRKRCDRLSGDDRSAFITRMQGAGTTSGSVAGSGVTNSR